MSGLIIQANLQHSKSATDCLVHDMMLAKCQVVALIQEPYLEKRNYPVGIPKIFGCYYQGEGGRGRSSILTKGCNLLLCPGYTGKDIVTCQLQMGMGEEDFVVSVYCDITINHVPLELVQLLETKITFRLDLETQAQLSQV